MDILTEILIVGALTLAFVGVMEATIVTVSWRGLKTAQDLQRKLAPVFRVFDRMPPERIDKAAKYLDRQFTKWEKMESELERQGL